MAFTSPDLYCCVAFDFEPSVPDELELKIGCIVKILKEIDQFWYFGQNLHDGSTGQFPKDFVNILTLPSTKPGETLLYALDSFYPEVNDDLPFKKGEIIVLSHKVDEAWGYGQCRNKNGIFPLNYTQRLVISKPGQDFPTTFDRSKIKCTVKATMPLSAQIEGELSFAIGDSIAVTEIMPDGWAVGQIGERSGSFPLSFTSYAEKSNSGNLQASNIAASNTSNRLSHSKKVSEFSNDAARTSIESPLKPLESTCLKHSSLPEEAQTFTASHQQPSSETNTGTMFEKSETEKSSLKGYSSISSGSDSGYNSYNIKDHSREKIPAVKPKKRFVIAKFSHFGRNSDELSFKEGDVIEVLESKSEMWLYGKLRGSTGHVPENYVSDYVLSHNGHSEISNTETLVEKLKSIQQESMTNEQKEHSKQALVNTMRKHDDVRLAVQDFKAGTEYELSLHVGDIVHVLQEVNDEWCEVKNNKGSIGFAPNSCLEHVKTSPQVLKRPSNGSVQRSQTFMVQKALPQTKGDKEKLYRTISCQPAISTDKSSDKNDALNKTNTIDVVESLPKTNRPAISSPSKKPVHQQSKEIGNQKGVSKGRSESIKRRNMVKRSNAFTSDKGAESTSSSETASSSKNWDNDSSSITSRDSAHSNNVPSSSCSTDSSGSLSKSRQSSFRSSGPETDLPSRRPLVRRASRIAPPPPTITIEQAPSHVDRSDVTAKLDFSNRSPPIRPPQPIPKTNPPPPGAAEDIKMTSAAQKLKIEKIRSEIEEYSRMQRSLDNMYSSTFDGKTRQEISEDKQFVVVKLKRLQSELQGLISDAIDVCDDTEPLPQISPNIPPNIYTPSPEAPPIQEDIVDVKEKRRVKRNHVTRELIKTEEDYLQDVVITINDIMKPLLERELPMDIKLDTVFGNIEEIRDCSKELLTSLKKIEDESSDLKVTVGSVIIEHASHMKEVYKIYCRNHDDATALLEKYEDDPEFQVPVQEYLNYVKNKVNTFDLGSFLIKPVQRILKYPLLLQELLKLADVPAPGEDRKEYDQLIQAVKMMQEVANDINEDKRRKDLVRKYRKGSQDANIVGKFSRISLHSVKKKSARISLRLGHVTGLNQPETVDENFNALEQRFKNLEKAVKSFLHNSDTYGNRYRDLLNLEHLLLEHVTDMWASDHSPMVEAYNASMRRIADQLYRQFHNHTQLKVHTPLNALLSQCKGPQALIEKRFDKLLDYENCQKNSDSKDKIQMAKNVYEALNQQLINEIPELCDLGYKLLDASISLFLRLQIRFQRNMIEVTEPVLKMCADNLKANQLDRKAVIEKYNAAKNQALVDMRHFSIIPTSFSAIASSPGYASPSANRLSSEHQVAPTGQPQVKKEALQNKFKIDDLYVATANFSSDDKMSLSCTVGDLIGAIKRQDPLGSATRWFCDDGGNQGFLPSNILKSYSSYQKSSLSSPNKSPNLQIPSPQRKSPTPSSNSAGCSDSSSPFSTSSVKINSNCVSFSRNKSFENKEATPVEDPRKLIDPNKVRMKEYWDRKKEVDRKQFRLDFPFFASSTLELTVRQGELVDLVENHDMDGNSEWWLVANAEGKQGYIPANYVSKIEYL